MELLIFPHQLFEEHPGLAEGPDRVVLVEDDLFFGDARYPTDFCKQKLWLHRASMKRYEASLKGKGLETRYVEYDPERRALPRALDGVSKAIVVDPTDFMLEKRLRRDCASLTLLPNPNFINTPEQNRDYREGKKRWFMADFYKSQRRRLDLLMEGDAPRGGQWSYDEENRKKVPKSKLDAIPTLAPIEPDRIEREAVDYVEQRFGDRPGSLDTLYYPTSHEAAREHLRRFVRQRLNEFGPYEDAIEEGQSWLWHGVLTPMLNIGLLDPQEVVETAVAHAEDHDVPLNSLEGFVRQVVGWREFMRATYEDLGVEMRNGNHWGHVRPMPACFYDATTGIDPIDDTIRRLLDTGYCHHIERLMVLGGFMFLCEIEPEAIYRWFMELFVDSYDWVMVPNVYAMSQHADGGLITTKPYFSGSSYVRKMSHYGKGEWATTWDGLYWRWIGKHVDELRKNPRWAMMCSQYERMDDGKRQGHLDAAAAFFEKLEGNRDG